MENDLADCVRELLGVIEQAIRSGDWMVDGACDPDADIERAKALLLKLEGNHGTAD